MKTVLTIKGRKIEKKEVEKSKPKNWIQTGMVRTYFLKDPKGKTIVRKVLNPED